MFCFSCEHSKVFIYLSLFQFAVPLLISPFFLGYFYCGIYGALREKECEFLVHLLITLLSTFVSIVGAALILFAGIDSLESRRRLTGRTWKFENGGGGDRHLQEIVKIVAYVVFCIVWNAFLVVFARNLHRRKRQQKVG